MALREGASQTNAGGGRVEAIGGQPAAAAGRKQRRFFQFTLRQILLLCALVGVLLCLLAPRIRWNFHVRRIQDAARKQLAAETDLRTAIRTNDVALARRALEAGADPNLAFDERSPNPQSRGPSVLNACIGNGQIAMMELLLDFGADVERVDAFPGKIEIPIHGASPLLVAAFCNQPADVRAKMVRLLAARGANPRKLIEGQSAMDMAFEASDGQMGDLLHELGLPYGPREMAAFNRLDELKAAVEETPEILEQNFKTAYAGAWPTLLGIALQRGHREMALFLIESGAPLDVKHNIGGTLLHAAARGGDVQLIRLLVERGLDVNAADDWSDTPLCDIASNGKAEAVATLVELGADVNWPGVNGQTPLHHAIRNNKLEIIRLLLAAGADPLLPNRAGETPLDLA